MFKLLTAALIALSLALPGAAQAQSKPRNDAAVIGTIAGIAALGVIAHQLSKDKKKDKKPEPPRPDWNHDRWDARPGHGPDWGKGPHQKAKVISSRCLIDLRDRKGEHHRILDRGCTRGSVESAKRLPDRCEVTIKTRKGNAKGYSPSCLERSGYVISRR